MPNSEPLYVGLMSGTSLDGIDAVLTSFSSRRTELRGHGYTPLPQNIRDELRSLSSPGDNEIDRCGDLDARLGELFAQSVLKLLDDAGVEPSRVHAIGSHGQTVRHRPDTSHPFTLQIGDPNRIAWHTGITTVADFRRKDIAAGGQGAPLVPPFHEYLFRSSRENRAILNIGGIANVTLLAADGDRPVVGFDTGPGNNLMDGWCRQHRNQSFDANGDWAADGSINDTLLNQMLEDEYFRLPAPKSSGPEYFNSVWLDSYLTDRTDKPLDIQATLAALTAKSAAQEILRSMDKCARVLVCGGGAHNRFLMELLQEYLPATVIESTVQHGLDPDLVEATAFAWLAYRTMQRQPGNLPSVTGASEPRILGGIYYP